MTLHCSTFNMKLSEDKRWCYPSLPEIDTWLDVIFLLCHCFITSLVEKNVQEPIEKWLKLPCHFFSTTEIVSLTAHFTVKAASFVYTGTHSGAFWHQFRLPPSLPRQDRQAERWEVIRILLPIHRTFSFPCLLSFPCLATGMWQTLDC